MHLMRESLENVAEKLKYDYQAELTLPPGGKRRKFSLEFKRRLVSEAECNHISADRLANEMGIGSSTICKWKRELAFTTPKRKQVKKSLFHKLEVQAEPQLNQQPGLYLEGKAGVRVVGLSLVQMAELLRCL